jgi:hypothetical protein
MIAFKLMPRLVNAPTGLISIKLMPRTLSPTINTDAAYRDFGDRYGSMARTRGFEWHVWRGPRRCHDDVGIGSQVMARK